MLKLFDHDNFAYIEEKKENLYISKDGMLKFVSKMNIKYEKGFQFILTM